ncbi:MAG: radical SAM family heme chaperone HemW, partial [Planctomycetes bacterium]|nr:radical SAM family heme chaperone HemW [Planctomycetota bacterium]
GRDDLIDRFLNALERELQLLERPRPVDTLFLGGGTPTHLAPAQLERLLEIVTRWFPPSESAEFSIEANPSDLRPEKTSLLIAAGVNRLSVGVQSFDDAKLSRLERDHRRAGLLRWLNAVRGRFASLSLDLIFGAPGESLGVWMRDLEAVIEQRPDHISTYGLTYEKGAAFWGRLAKGRLRAADEELERQMYLSAIDRLTAAGWEHYEVSNFARPGHRCHHNETYWTGGEYYAAGPGAARYVSGVRETNHRSTTTWMQRVLAGRSPVAYREQLGSEDKARERLVFQLRMIDGVDEPQFQRETGFRVESLVGEQLPELVTRGLIARCGNTLRLTREGLLVSDSIWPRFLVPER